MAVISISIEESSEQIISGIPKNISISVNIPSTIFYTLDGSVPTTDSSIYLGPINFDTNQSGVNINIFATNGIDYSPVINKIYQPSSIGQRKPRSKVLGLSPNNNKIDPYPYGDNSPSFPVKYGNTGGFTVDAPDIPNIPDGYDGTNTGTFTNGTDLPLASYQFRYSNTNSLGETGPGIGTLPGKALIRPTEPIPTLSKTSDKLFNPKALVIYQDSRNPSFDDSSLLNRCHFSLQDNERTKEGANLLNTAFDSNLITGNFIRQYFNPKENTITYYYRDSNSGRWIISVEPFVPKNNNIGALYNIVFSNRRNGSNHVYKYIPFLSRKLI